MAVMRRPRYRLDIWLSTCGNDLQHAQASSNVRGPAIVLDVTMQAAPSGEASGTQTIARAAQVLACFSSERPHLKLVELSDLLGLSQSTTYRYLAALESGGLVVRDPRLGGYRLGLKVIELAGIAINQIDARKYALDDMELLSAETGLLVNLAVLFEGDVLHIAHVAPPGVPRSFTALGRRAVAHCTSLGK